MKPISRRLLRGLCALLVLAGLPPATAVAGTAADRNPRSSWQVDLTSTTADQRNIAHRPDDSITVKSARVRTPSEPEASFAVYTAPAQSLGRQARAFTLRRQAEVPSGTRLLTEVRGSAHPGTWTEWRTPDRAGKLVLAEAVSVLQVRLTFLGSRDAGPSVSDVTVHADREQPGPSAGARGAVGATATTYRLFATREGLEGHTTANGHVIQPRDHFVALPSRRMLASNGGHEYQVRLCYPRTGRCETAPVWDVGPWNTRDDYWNAPSVREMWGDLPQGRPEAQAAYQNGYNGGRDEFGRTVANPAGIDLADGTFWDGLGMTDNDWVDVTFQPTDGGGGPTTVTAWTRANVRGCASTSCDVVSTVQANESYPANCWKVGQTVTAEGYTNDKWVELPLRAGGVGYVSAIFLTGDDKGGVTTRCSS